MPPNRALSGQGARRIGDPATRLAEKDFGCYVTTPMNAARLLPVAWSLPGLFALVVAAASCSSSTDTPSGGSDAGSNAPSDAGGGTGSDAAGGGSDAAPDAAAQADAGEDASTEGCKFVDGESFISGPVCSKVKELRCGASTFRINCNCKTETCTCSKDDAVYKTIPVASGTCSSCQDVYASDLLTEEQDCAIQ